MVTILKTTTVTYKTKSQRKGTNFHIYLVS